MLVGFVGRADPQLVAAAVAFEDAVLPLLEDHGAQVRFRGRRAAHEDPALPLEVHVLWFPHRSAYEGYLADPRRQALLVEHGDVFSEKLVVELDDVTGR